MTMRRAIRAVVAAAGAAFIATAPVAAFDQNTVIVTGIVTHIEHDAEFLVVSSNYAAGAYTEVIVPCPAKIAGCTTVAVDDGVFVVGHFGSPVECGGDGSSICNPIVVNWIATCVGTSCEKF